MSIVGFDPIEIEARIAAAKAMIAEGNKRLEYWQLALSVLTNPLFDELNKDQPAVQATAAALSSSSHATNGYPSTYGLLKRRTYELLPLNNEGHSPQELALLLQRSGYIFKTKTPHISVNEALQTLKTEGKARIAGKNSNGANMWAKDENWQLETEKEAPIQETS